VRVRGLKPSKMSNNEHSLSSHPVRVRGLKHISRRRARQVSDPSHPVRVRGLKQTTFTQAFQGILSHPVRVRGLKLEFCRYRLFDGPVAPRAGAWVETYNTTPGVDCQASRTPCGCVG